MAIKRDVADEMDSLDVAVTAPTIEEIQAQRQDILRIAAEHGMRNVRVLSAVARCTATNESDIDLLIDFVGPAPEDFGYYGLLLEIQEAIEQLFGHSVHVVHFEIRTLRGLAAFCTTQSPCDGA